MDVKTNFIVAVSFFLSAVILRADDNAPVFEIPHLDKITVDGKADDWGDKGFHIDVLAENSPNLRAAGNFYSNVRLGWNDAGLCILMQINDDVNLEDANEDRLWSKDSI